MDRGRLARAKRLPVEHLGERYFKVGRHYVDLSGETPCHCEDALLKGTQHCKHYIAAMLYEQGER